MRKHSLVNESKENLVFRLETHSPPCLLSVPYFVEWMYFLKAMWKKNDLYRTNFIFSRKVSLREGIF